MSSVGSFFSCGNDARSHEHKEKLKNKFSYKSVQWEQNCSMRTNGQTDRQTLRKVIVAFRNVAKGY